MPVHASLKKSVFGDENVLRRIGRVLHFSCNCLDYLIKRERLNRELSVCRWSFSELFFKNPGEICLVIKANLITDLGDGFIGLVEKFGRTLQPERANKGAGWLINKGVEFPVELRDAHIQCLGKMFNLENFFTQILLDNFNSVLQEGLIERAFCNFRRLKIGSSAELFF